MRRVDIPVDKRVPYYVFVDEFQNFATDSFIKILSEIRKYNLSLCLANQYMAQIPENVRQAILGNAGTIITFSAGAEDAAILNKEFAEVFSESDLVNLSNYQIAIKLMIEGHSSRPFLAHTLPLPISKNQNRQKVITVSRERWTQKEKAPYTHEPAFVPHPTYQRRHFPPRRFQPPYPRPTTTQKQGSGNIFQGHPEEKQNQD